MQYIVFFAIWIIVFVYFYGKIREEKMAALRSPFDHPFFREMYRLSFRIPFKWFVEDDNQLTRKGEQMKEYLELSGYSRYFTVRSFMAFKVVLLILCLMVGSMTVMLMSNMDDIAKVLFHKSIETKPVSLNAKVAIFSMFLLIVLLPNIIVKNKAKRAIVNHNKDLPMIQMFVILLLRSNKTVSEILYALSKINTYHREVFERGYRMYLRNKHEGISYLRSKFNNARFIEMFNLLEDIAEYAREECIQILESNMKALVEETNQIKRRNDLSRLVYSHATMMVPFIAVLLLGAAPIVVLGIRIFSNSTF